MGGRGAEHLGVKPGSKNASAHIKLVVGRDFKQPNLKYFGLPLMVKGTNRKQTVQIPFRLVGDTLAEEYDGMENTPGDDPLASLPRYGMHPVVQTALLTSHWSRIVPVALYWDGVRYTTKASSPGLPRHCFGSG